MKKIKSIIIFAVTFITLFLISCSGVELAKPKSVASYFSKALIEGNKEKAENLSNLESGVLEKYITKIRGKYKDFTINEMRKDKEYHEIVNFIPVKIDNPELRLTLILTFSGKIIGDKGKKAATVINIKEAKLSKEQTVKQFLEALKKGENNKAVTYLKNSSFNIQGIIEKVKGFDSYQILQLTENDSGVMIEIKNKDKSIILNMNVEQQKGKFVIDNVKAE